MGKNLHEINGLREELKKHKTLDHDKNIEIRQLKKMVKRLKMAIVEDSEDNDDDDTEVVIDYIPLAETVDSLKCIKTYQTIKDYLIMSKQSLRTLCYNNKLFGQEKHNLYSSFLVKKLRRLDIYHPIVEPIQNDEDVINLILT